MEQESVSAILARLTALERSHRRMRVLALLFGALAVVGTLTGQASVGPTIIGDPNGARTTVSPRGVIVYDASNVVRLDMTLDGATPGIGVHGPDGKFVFEVAGGNLGGILRLKDNTNAERIYAGIFSSGSAGVEVYRPNGKTALAADDSESGAFLRLNDTAGNERTYLGMYSSGRAGLQISSANGKPVIEANGGTTGGYLRASDNAGTDRAVMGLFTDSSSGVTVHNASGTLTWRSPAQ
jgi:hypothetical protein